MKKEEKSKKVSGEKKSIFNAGGVIPSLCLKAELGPPRSECGVGALMAWADRLWAISYVSSSGKSGRGTGLYEIDEELNMTKRMEGRTGTYTNRMVHYPSNQLIIGPHIIDEKRKIRTIEELVDVRICATMKHLSDEANKVYILGMEGEFYELNVYTGKTKFISDIKSELKLPFVHFKAGYTNFGKVIVADNSYDALEFQGKRDAGCLAEWDGRKWTKLENSPFVEVTGRGNFGNTIFASGWDRASAILKVYTDENKKWTAYRLPKASHTFDHMWQTEWPRIRETEHERFLMDCHGMFYELSPWAYSGHVWGIRPISTHLWVLGDFCTFRGMLVMGADNASPAGDKNLFCGEPQSGLWFGKTDDLWSFGKPSGWGGPWWKSDVISGEPSDPYLMTGFDKKCLHLTHDASAAVNFTVEVDFLGNGSWRVYDKIPVAKNGYVHHEFNNGFSAHWIRFTADRDCQATAYLTYS